MNTTIKKRSVFGLFAVISLFVGLLFVSVVSAQTTTSGFPAQVDKFVSTVGQSLEPIFRYTLGDVGRDSNLLFVKVLVFLLMISAVYMAVKNVPGLNNSPFVKTIIVIAVSILAARFLSSKALVEFVWLPSGVTGIAFSVLLPFILYFFFINNFQSGTIRRIGWIFYTLLFIGLAIVRWDALGQGESFNLATIYLATALISLLAFWFDKTIHARFLYSAIEAKGEQLAQLNAAEMQQEIAKYNKIIASSTSTPKQVDAARKQIAELNKKIQDVLKG